MAAVEFAIILIVLLTIIMAIIDFGRLLYVKQGVTQASREGARSAVVASSATAKAWATTSCQAASSAQGISAGAMTIQMGTGSTTACVNGAPSGTVADSPCVAASGSAKVTVTSTFKWLTPVGIFIGLGNTSGGWQIGGSTTMRCE